MLDPTETEQAVGVAPEYRRLALEDLDLEAEAVVEVDVEGREHPGAVGVAGLDQALGELEKRLGRTLRPGKRGRPRSEKNDPRQLELV